MANNTNNSLKIHIKKEQVSICLEEGSGGAQSSAVSQGVNLQEGGCATPGARPVYSRQSLVYPLTLSLFGKAF